MFLGNINLKQVRKRLFLFFFVALKIEVYRIIFGEWWRKIFFIEIIV